ncbi:MAG: hypothetical protein FJX47_22030, partial [Alphaproteobacteria bacterium]|nr:hypothetical protein [Alphaproteobacteria bacterium]
MKGMDRETRALFRKRRRPSPAIKLLGFQVLEIDREAGTAMARFQARKTFGNQLGTLQGGIIAAMLDEV